LTPLQGLDYRDLLVSFNLSISYHETITDETHQ